MQTSTALSPSVGAVLDAFKKYIIEDTKRGPSIPRSYLYASARRRCLRRSVLEATEPQWFYDFDTEAKTRMRRGSQRERDIVIDLKRAGRFSEPEFDIIGEQESVKIHDRNGRLIISGKIDGWILWEDGSRWPLEIKSWSPFLTDRIEQFSDLYTNQWTWPGAHQLLAYLFAKPEPVGLLVLDRPGLPRLIEVRLEENLEQMEAFLEDAMTCVDHIEAGTLPDYINDASECKRCPAFGSRCNPPIGSGPGAQILSDPELEAMLTRRHELEPAADEFSEIDKQVKAQLRGVELGIAGRFLVEGKWGKNTTYPVPDDIKQKYKKVDPKGKFTLTFTRL